MTKGEIVQKSENIFFLFADTCKAMEYDHFFKHPPGKWSAAENLQHLIISTTTSTIAFKLPLFLIRLIGGRPNRPSRMYKEVESKYNKKLIEGGVARGRYVPKPIELRTMKQPLLNNWAKACKEYITSLKNNRLEKDLDTYLVKHPLLGRITLRELCYFTIFHTQHHLNIILATNN